MLCQWKGLRDVLGPGLRLVFTIMTGSFCGLTALCADLNDLFRGCFGRVKLVGGEAGWERGWEGGSQHEPTSRLCLCRLLHRSYPVSLRLCHDQSADPALMYRLKKRGLTRLF